MDGRFMWPGIVIISFMLLACASKPASVSLRTEKVTELVITKVAMAGWEARWEKALNEARKEGVVVVYGPAIAEVRVGFIEAFQRRYPGIRLEYTGMGGAETSPKISAERRAGLYLVDMHIGGTTTMLTALRDFLVPIKPFLILPEVTEQKNWMDGKLDFSDEAEELNLVFTFSADSKVAYNTDLVNPDEITSYWDLTKAKFREKIIMRDPRAAGVGLATATFWYLHPQLGLDYLKAFAANKPTLTRDRRLLMEATARGKYLITIGPVPAEIDKLSQMGMPIKTARIMKEGAYSTPSTGTVAILDRAPHPNATTVFLSWLLGKEGQTVWATKAMYASRRLDVPTDHLPEAERPVPGAAYSPNYKEKIVMMKDEIVPYLNEIFTGF